MSLARIIRFWKPYGVLTKFTDTEGRPTLANYLTEPGIYAAGRLDMDSEGLLLLTDSGKLNVRLTNPEYEHPRTYWVQVERIPSFETLEMLRNGVLLKDGITRPAEVSLMQQPDLPERAVPVRYRKSIPTAWIMLRIIEGRNRQVRRMTAAVGHPTLRLVRWSIGPVTLDGLSPGTWAILDEKETQALWRSASRKAQ